MNISCLGPFKESPHVKQLSLSHLREIGLNGGGTTGADLVLYIVDNELSQYREFKAYLRIPDIV